MSDVNGLYPTPVRLALLRAIRDGHGRVYLEAGDARDNATGAKVTDKIRQMLAAEWIRALKPDEPRGPGEHKARTYYPSTGRGPDRAIERTSAMSDYNAVTSAMNAGTPPELICAACPWDRLCITPPQMSSAEIDAKIAEAEAKDAARLGPKGGLPTGMLMTAMVLGGRDRSGDLCPVFALKLKSPDGRQIADTLRTAMRGESA